MKNSLKTAKQKFSTIVLGWLHLLPVRARRVVADGFCFLLRGLDCACLRGTASGSESAPLRGEFSPATSRPNPRQTRFAGCQSALQSAVRFMGVHKAGSKSHVQGASEKLCPRRPDKCHQAYFKQSRVRGPRLRCELWESETLLYAERRNGCLGLLGYIGVCLLVSTDPAR